MTATDPLNASNLYVTSFDSYDSVGRILQSTQTTPGSTRSSYVFHYTYNVAGQVETIQYPSHRTLSACYDTADRPLSVNNGVTATPYATVNQYAPHGAIHQMTMGNGLVETTGFNAAAADQHAGRVAAHSGLQLLPGGTVGLGLLHQ